MLLSVNYKDRQYHLISNNGATAKIIKVNATDGKVSGREKAREVSIAELDFVFLNKEYCLGITKEGKEGEER